MYKSSVGGSKLAVDKLDMTMYSGQITALLGHNGAGKTTLIAMLTGMTPATGGNAFVAGRDAMEDMSNIRNSLGVCPQHDILYPTLTVREHLRLYAVLKGVPHAQLEEAVKVRLSTTTRLVKLLRAAPGWCLRWRCSSPPLGITPPAVSHLSLL